MTDLISLSDILSSLQDRSQTKIDLYDANAALQALHDTYEYDRTATRADFDLQMSIKADTNNALSAQVADLQSNVGALNGTITSLQTQVMSLTQRNASLDLSLNNTLLVNGDLRVQVASLTPDVTVMIDASTLRTSNFATAISHVAAADLRFGNATAIARAKASLATGLTLHRISACASFGVLDPWHWDGTGTRPTEPTNWSSIDDSVNMVLAMGGTPILGWGNWPWWMKGMWDGTKTVPMTYADEFNTDGRPYTEQMVNLLHLVDVTVRRYAAAPYNVRYWQLGQWEFHGFFLGRDGTFNSYGYDNLPGAANQASMGMAYLHNQVAQRIVSTMTALGIPRSQYTIATNYPPMPVYGTANAQCFAAPHPLRNQPWGSVDKRSVAAMLGMLPLLDPTLWDVWTFDLAASNKDGVVTTDDWTNLQRYTDITAYLKMQVAALGYSTKRLWISEIYPKPVIDPGANSQRYRAAILADACRLMLLQGVEAGIVWSNVGRGMYPSVAGPCPDAGLTTPVAAVDGGVTQASFDVVKMFHDHFGPGTPVYDATITGSGVSAIASDKVTMLINRTNGPRKVALGLDTYLLDPYEMRVVGL